MRIQRFEDVIAWQRAKLLNIEIYHCLKDIRNFTFRDQILGASLSIMNNIAEGFDRGSDAELKQFLTIARGSSAEVKSMLLLSVEFGYMDTIKQQHLLELTSEVSKLLTGFINKLTRPKSLTTVD